jgi:hypothetical protein
VITLLAASHIKLVYVHACVCACMCEGGCARVRLLMQLSEVGGLYLDAKAVFSSVFPVQFPIAELFWYLVS